MDGAPRERIMTNTAHGRLIGLDDAELRALVSKATNQHAKDEL